LLYICFETYPKFMNKEEPKNEIPFYKIYDETSTIADIKDFMITYRVKKIMQSNNIIESILKFEKLFGFKFNIDKVLLDNLFVTAMNRNLLTHNNGIVNDIYLNQLKGRNVPTNLIKGDKLPVD